MCLVDSPVFLLDSLTFVDYSGIEYVQCHRWFLKFSNALVHSSYALKFLRFPSVSGRSYEREVREVRLLLE